MTALPFSAQKSIERIPGISPEDTHLLTLAEAYQQRPELIDVLSRLDSLVETGDFSGEVPRIIADAFAPGFYVRLQRYIHNHSVADAIDMMRANRWREELFSQKKV